MRNEGRKEGRKEGRTNWQLYAPPKFYFGEHKNIQGLCSSSHCVNTFFVTVNNGGGGAGGGGGVSIAAVAAHVVEPAADKVLHSVGSELQPAPDCKAAYPGAVTAE
ncbi:hypothetical protein DPMN_079199 [Dreissena polymorpha]|uniref:Uncharacterized protein n=1 Tax=Dreissena polymorpha TaxID=45954 RepID=A0A9D3YNN3_DREPO|nr:hypothetical protein DPMN_079199 [Dreissena polymorpha]